MLETPSTTHLQRPEQTNHTTQDQSTESTTPITCVICQASYTPSNLYQRFLQVSPIVLESAYMSMCHYCFRCRRPSCPECWDPIHRICAACVQDTNLPFRTQVEPLDGILLPSLSPDSPPEATHDNTASSLFICVKHGKFHTLTTPSTAITPTETTPPQSTVKPSKPLPNTTQEPPPSPQAQPDPYIGAPLAGALETASALESSSVPTLEPAHVLESPSIEAPEADPSVDTFPIDAALTKPRKSPIKKLELILTAILLLALLATAIIIALAEYSIKANTFIDQLLHIDIRAEITYLLHIIQQHL